MNPEAREPKSPNWRVERALLFLLLGFVGGGVGVLIALFFDISSWLEARLFIGSGVAIGLGLASFLAPNLLSLKHREASAPKQ